MNLKMILFSILAITVTLFYSHKFAFNAGENSVKVAVQAGALDNVVSVAEKTKVINVKDAERYAALDKNNRLLKSKYDKLLFRSRIKVEPDDAEKYAVCTYDSDTIKLLVESAQGGLPAGEAASNGSRPDDTLYRPGATDNRNPPGDNRKNHNKQQAFLGKSLLTAQLDTGGKRQKP